MRVARHFNAWRAADCELDPVAPMRRTTPDDFATLFPADRRGPLWTAEPRLARLVPADGCTPFDARACTWPGAARIRARACRWRHCRAGLRRTRSARTWFRLPVPPPDGYAWWYVDALSDDGRHALTIIAFVGSVFSPYYAAARRRGAGRPARPRGDQRGAVRRHGARRWTMTERGPRSALTASADVAAHRSERAGLGRMTRWSSRSTSSSAPWPRRVRGCIRIQGVLPGAAADRSSMRRDFTAGSRSRRERGSRSTSTCRRCAGPATAMSTRTRATCRSKTAFASWQWCRTPRPGWRHVRPLRRARARRAARGALRLDIAPGWQRANPTALCRSRALEPRRAGASRAPVTTAPALCAHPGRRSVLCALAAVATPWQGQIAADVP